MTEGKYDLAISALAYTPERAEAMNLSNGYYFDDEEGWLWTPGKRRGCGQISGCSVSGRCGDRDPRADRCRRRW